MTGTTVRRMSADEHKVYSELMRLTGGHLRDEYHHALAGWRNQGSVHQVNLFAELGARSPASLHEGPVYSVFTYDEVLEVYRNPAVFSSEAVRLSFGRAWGKTIITEDPPEHGLIRNLVQPLFTRKAVEAWKTEIFEPTVRAHLAAIINEGGGDLHNEVLLPFPVAIIHRLMGLDRNPELGDHFHRLALQLFMVRAPDPTPGLAAAEELYEFFLGLIEERRKELHDGTAGEDLATRLVEINDRDHVVADDELARFLRLLLPGGADTTTNSTGNMFVQMLNHPEQLEAVRADRSLLNAVVEEAIRFDGTTSATYRGVTKDYELGGTMIPAGSMVVCSVSSANRDERRYVDPDVFDITRSPAGHVGFGHGLHLCLGAHMARAEMTVALDVILDELPRLRPDPDFEPPFVCGALHRHPGHLRVRWD